MDVLERLQQQIRELDFQVRVSALPYYSYAQKHADLRDLLEAAAQEIRDWRHEARAE